MEKDKLTDIFSCYRPPLGQSSLSFMSHLNDKLEAVEIIKQRSDARRRSSRRAVVLAAIGGTVTGSLLTAFVQQIMWCVEFVGQWVRKFAPSLPEIDSYAYFTVWTIIAVCSVGAALGVYDLSKSLLPDRK